MTGINDPGYNLPSRGFKRICERLHVFHEKICELRIPEIVFTSWTGNSTLRGCSSSAWLFPPESPVARRPRFFSIAGPPRPLYTVWNATRATRRDLPQPGVV
jgi:hypothetical protein